MKTINFKSNSLMKNFKKALKASKHIVPGETIHFTTGSMHNKIFPRNSHVNNYIDAILGEIMSNQIIQNNFSKKDLEEEIIIILENLDMNDALNMNDADFLKLYKSLVNDFENKIINIIKNKFDEFECIFHVENLQLGNKIKIGDVTLFPFDNEIKYNAINEELINDKFFKENETYAKTKIYGFKESARELSQVKIKISLNILKLFLPDYRCNFNLDGDTFTPKYRDYLLINRENDILKGFIPKGLSHGCNFEKDIGDIDFELFRLSILLKSNPKSEFENRLITSIYWFGEALSLKIKNKSKIENERYFKLGNIEFFEAYDKLLYLIISLETLFVYGGEPKSKAVSCKVSELISKPGYEEEISSFLEKIYDYRSKIVHSGSVFISKKDMDTLIHFTRIALFQV